MELTEELDQMNKALTEVPQPKVEEPKKEESKVEEPKEEEKVEEPPKEPESKEEAKVEPEVKEEPKVEPVVDPRDKAIADLKAEIELLKAKKSEPEIKKEELKKEEPKIESQDFVGDIDLDEVTREPAKLNEIFNKVYQKAMIDSRNEIMKSLPSIIETNVKLVDDMKKTRETFYKENPDLESFQKVVGVVFEELAGANPNKTYNEIIQDVAPEVRKRLGLPTKEVSKEPKLKLVESETPPKLPKQGSKAGSHSNKPSAEPLLSEIEEMNVKLGR